MVLASVLASARSMVAKALMVSSMASLDGDPPLEGLVAPPNLLSLGRPRGHICHRQLLTRNIILRSAFPVYFSSGSVELRTWCCDCSDEGNCFQQAVVIVVRRYVRREVGACLR